jgi:hypothetical protein
MQGRRSAPERERRAKAFTKSRVELLLAIDAWHEVKRIQAFFTEAETSAQELGDAEKAKLLKRIALVRTVIGDVSPLKVLGDWRGPNQQ